MGFIDEMRAKGHAVESIIRVLREQGMKVAARTYRAWRQGRVAVRTVTDAQVVDAVRDVAWTTDVRPDGSTFRKVAPEGLYGRRKMTALIRRTILPDASWGAVDRAMRLLGLVGITRAKGVRTTIPAKDGNRAGDLLNRDFSAPRPDHTWVMDFTYVRTWAGFVYVAFVLDVFAQRIVGWHAQTSMHTNLVLTPLRIALWERERQGHPIRPDQLRAHSDAGAQYTSLAFTEELQDAGITGSIGSVGDALDNALMESTIGLYKAEVIWHERAVWESWQQVEQATASWVQWYNAERLHSSLGDVPPVEYEEIYYDRSCRSGEAAAA